MDKLNHYDLDPVLIETAKRWIRIKCKFADRQQYKYETVKNETIQNTESELREFLQTQARDSVMDVSVQPMVLKPRLVDI